MPDAHVAQLNIGVMVAPTDDPAVAEFMDNLDRINARADGAPGFVWRLQSDAGNATDIQIFPNPLQLVNMSVWKTVEELKAYVYRSEHVDFFRRRAEWFERDGKRVALWAVAPGTIPDLADAVRRVEFLERYGPTPYAFGFSQPPPPLVFESTDPDDVDTRRLIADLDDGPAASAGPAIRSHVPLRADEVTGDAGAMIRARCDGELVGCGAFRRMAPGVAELRQLLVGPDGLDWQLGAAMLDQLEWRAGAAGVRELRIDTGSTRPATLESYESRGYRRCDPWAEHQRAPDAGICVRKPLAA